MYVSMKPILEHAHINGYAVMAMNSINMEMVRAAVNAAQAEHSAVIINIGMGQMKNHAHPEDMVPMIRQLAERALVPVALNLDHGQDFTFICECMKRGFSSIMIDASALPYEENIARTRLVCEMAHPLGICVEGELGHVGQAADGDDENGGLYTEPGQAKEFADRTGVDALAVAVGTAHGNYPKGKTPKLDFERIRLLKKILNMPLVLHGGSGAGEENLKKAVACGINKVNVCTDAFGIGSRSIEKQMNENPEVDYMHLCMGVEEELTNYIRTFMRTIGSSGQYYFGEGPLSGNE